MGRFWIFFLGGAGEGRRRRQDTFSIVCFFVGRHEFPNSPFYVIHYIFSNGGFTPASSDHREGAPGPRRPGQTRALFKFRQPDDFFHTLKTLNGLRSSFHHGLHGAVGMVFYAHMVYVTCYFCYMFSLGPSSGTSDSVRIYRRVIFGK